MTAVNMNLQTDLKKGLHLIVLRHAEVSMEDVMTGHAKAGPDHTLISDREVTDEMLAAINADIKILIAKMEKKHHTKLPYAIMAEKGSTSQNFTVSQKYLN